MNFKVIFSFSVCIIVVTGIHKSLFITPDDDESITIPSNIISNYIITYFGNQSIFISIKFVSSSYEQDNSHQRILDNLVKDVKLSQFSFKILKEGQSTTRRYNKIALNLILADETISFR